MDKNSNFLIPLDEEQIQTKDDNEHNKEIVKTLSGEINNKYLFHKQKFQKFRNINRAIILSTSFLNSLGISSLGIFFLSEENSDIPAIVAMALNTLSFVISSISLAFQLNDKMNREKILAGQYNDISRDLEKTISLHSDSFEKEMTTILVEQTIEKIQLIEDYESSV